jgi:hypothetical protein
MRQMIKRYLWIVLVAAPLTAGFAFSLLGPVGNPAGSASGTGGDAWQVQANGFNPLTPYSEPFNLIDVNPDGPKNLGEEYRCNAPVMYYACDANFLDYFGMSGMTNVESAFAILNNLTNVDSYSSDLSEFPLQSENINYTAQTWSLFDLKSLTLALMMEQVGLADSIRYTWVIHDRYIVPNSGLTCPNGIDYLVVSRNFDLLSSLPAGSPQYYSPYVNDTLYSYFIDEFCNSTPPSPLTAAAVAQNLYAQEEFQNAPVASGVGIAAEPYGGAYGHLLPGGYYTGLTRDDVQGLRYLYSTNNVNFEPTALGSVLLSSTGGGSSGLGPQFVLYTSNYTAFVQAALTNAPSVLTNLYPGLIVLSTTYGPYTFQTPNIVSYLTNAFVLGNPPALVITASGSTSTVMLLYTNTYANLIVLTNGFHANTSAQLVTVTVTPGGVAGNSFVTNTTVQSITLTNVPSGDYYIATNPCGNEILYQLPYTNVVATTNLILVASNSAGDFFSENLVIYSTNHAYWAAPILCSGGGTVAVTNSTGLYQGAGKLQFVQANYDSLLGQFFLPVTNIYSSVFVTNFQPVAQTFQRVVIAPDFIFSASDQVAGPSGDIYVSEFSRTLPAFVADPGYVGLAGPGVINAGGAVGSSITIAFDKSLPVYLNTVLTRGTNNLDSFLYGSFDGTTNTPIVYPDATSITKLEAAVYIQVSPSSPGGLPPGSSNTVYNAAISAIGGQPPYNWSLVEGQLPDGLSLTNVVTGGVTNNVISGTPTRPGTFYFTIQMNDSSPSVNTMNWDYSITIN